VKQPIFCYGSLTPRRIAVLSDWNYAARCSLRPGGSVDPHRHAPGFRAAAFEVRGRGRITTSAAMQQPILLRPANASTERCNGAKGTKTGAVLAGKTTFPQRLPAAAMVRQPSLPTADLIAH
jgi:hypothetical protein